MKRSGNAHFVTGDTGITWRKYKTIGFIFKDASLLARYNRVSTGKYAFIGGGNLEFFHIDFYRNIVTGDDGMNIHFTDNLFK